MEQQDPRRDSRRQLAELVRQACIQAAREGFTEASMSGLCTEGAMEAAVGAIQSLDLDKLTEGSNPEEAS